MPFKTFNTWLFDGNIKSTIPTANDVLKYNSPITHTFVLSLFLRNGKLNHYLNNYFNNINLRYLPKEELFYFIKRCVIDFRIKKRDIVFYPRMAKNKLYDKLREKTPILKNGDISLLCDIIDKSEDKNMVYQALDIEKPKKQKVRTKKTKKKKITLKEFLSEHFSIMKV
jgi:hypothetical protein